ncbi:hypothetical protein AOQ84DRAFT_390542 [Glonium stellatum]|uniref:Uncharacterized protein n=1 Tax=Glonium stellatum TaxID=574774 RepID=A0A8E2EW33_9PEZI|nr:hypothetical protein AOQ84DRAFT_390542 [Glonium stellatum]
MAATQPTASVTATMNDSNLIASYNRGPITTYFDFPTSCLSTLTSSSPLFFGHFYDSYVDPSCYPLGTLSASDVVGTDSWDLYYYSPGYCPNGWRAVTTISSVFPASLSIGSILYTGISLGPDTTAAICCPSGYQYASASETLPAGHLCSTSLTENTVLSFLLPTNDGDKWLIGNISTTTWSTGEYIFGDGIPIWWKSGDLSILSSAATATPPTSLSASTSKASPTPTSTILPPTSTSTSTSARASTPLLSSQNSRSGGLSTGTEIGISVAIPVAIIAILVFGILIYFRRHRRANRTAHPVQSDRDGTAWARYPNELSSSEPALVGQETHSHHQSSHPELR